MLYSCGKEGVTDSSSIHTHKSKCLFLWVEVQQKKKKKKKGKACRRKSGSLYQ